MVAALAAISRLRAARAAPRGTRRRGGARRLGAAARAGGAERRGRTAGVLGHRARSGLRRERRRRGREQPLRLGEPGGGRPGRHPLLPDEGRRGQPRRRSPWQAGRRRRRGRPGRRRRPGTTAARRRDRRRCRPRGRRAPPGPAADLSESAICLPSAIPRPCRGPPRRRPGLLARVVDRLGGLELGVLVEVAEHAHRGALVERLLDLGRQRDVLDDEARDRDAEVGEVGRQGAGERRRRWSAGWPRGRASAGSEFASAVPTWLTMFWRRNSRPRRCGTAGRCRPLAQQRGRVGDLERVGAEGPQPDHPELGVAA